MEVATLDSLQLTAWAGSRDALLELILEAKRFYQVQLPVKYPSPRCNHTTRSACLVSPAPAVQGHDAVSCAAHV